MPRCISVRLHAAFDTRLKRIARRRGHSKSFHVQQALADQHPDPRTCISLAGLRSA